MALAAGCHGIHAKYTPLKVLMRHRAENRAAREGDPDPACTARTLEAGLSDHPDAATLLALADSCHRAAHRLSAEASRPWYRDAAVYAAFAVAASEDPCICLQAQTIHNQAVERLIRQAQAWRVRGDRQWQCTLTDLNIELNGPRFLCPCRFTNIDVASDYAVSGLECEYRNDGFGLPVIARRDNDRECPTDPEDRYFSYRIHAAATAAILPHGTPCNWRDHKTTLTFFDPFAQRTASVAGRCVTLATDRSTPLAVQEQFSSLEVLRRVGVLRPDRVRKDERGLYMYQPYRPGKIPLVLVHGFYSSPSTWSQVVNHIQNDPELSERYQVWLFLYPTGAPLTASAADFRSTLRKAIDFFDPCGRDPALRQMVVVGHSMGGLISKMAVMESGDCLWRAYFNTPFDAIQASPKVKDRLEETLFLHPEPYIRRMIFVAAPHRGTIKACLIPGQFIQERIHHPLELREIIREVIRCNGRSVVADGVRARPLNGVGNMSIHDPALKALLCLPIAVPFHSIIPQVSLLGHQLNTDGIVRYRSSHLDGAESEKITRGFHTSHSKQDFTEELKRILHDNLNGSGLPPVVSLDEKKP